MRCENTNQKQVSRVVSSERAHPCLDIKGTHFSIIRDHTLLIRHSGCSCLGTNIHQDELAGESSLHIVIQMTAMVDIRVCQLTRR